MIPFNDSDMFVMVIVLLIIGAIIGVGLFVGLPWLWGMVKPFLHTLTA